MYAQPDREIAGCISDIGISFTVQDLQKPNPQQIQKVFEWFAELLMNTTRDVVAPGMRVAAEDIGGDDADRIFTADTRELMGFFVMLRRLMQEVSRLPTAVSERKELTTTVWRQRFHFLRPLSTDTSAPCEDLFVHHQFHTLPRIADLSY